MPKTVPTAPSDACSLNGASAAIRPAIPRSTSKRRFRVVPIVITLGAAVLALFLVKRMWQVYVVAPWTRDGTVRAYVVTMAPQVAGQVVELPIADNQFVRKGDLLMVIDPTSYEIAVRLAKAAADQARAVAQNAKRQAERRAKLSDIAISDEQRQIFVSQAASADAGYEQTLAKLAQAKTDLARTRIISPVDGYVTNLNVQRGDYVNVGQLTISLVDERSFWVDGYFEETSLRYIHKGDAATIKLLGSQQLLRGRVEGMARAIKVANAQPDGSGLASVNPIFTWVRLAQRVPVRIHIDSIPLGVELVAGMTATVQIESGTRAWLSSSRTVSR